jgi:RNA polymerase sigma-70 factor (ECF subfamily)
VFNNQKLNKSLLALKNGDDQAFGYIYEATERLVYFTVYSILKNRTRTEDIMQNTYLKVYENIGSYQSNAPKAWIVTIARNLAINEYNRLKREQLVETETLDAIASKDENTDTPLINLAAKKLPEDEFMIVMLCVCEGYRRREVAEMMNLSTSGVTWKLDQALKKLRKLAEEVES